LSKPPVGDFTSNRTTISAGGSVVFTDLSTYKPNSWKWVFDGGTPATYNGEKPPAVSYSTPGTYDVSLTVSSTNGSDTKTKTNYITVSPASSCTSINYPAPADWSFTNYYTGGPEVGTDGWINGKNVYQDKEKAMYFDASGSGATFITKVWIAFGVAYSASPDKTVPIRIYDGSSGSPGAQLASQNIKMAQIMADKTGGVYTEFNFSPAVSLPASKKFFVSVDVTNLEWTAGVKDTLSITSNSNGQTVPSAVWERQADDKWYHYNTTGSWPLNVSLLIHPYITQEPGLATFTSSGTTICSGETVSFNAAGSTYQDTLLWVFSGGTPSLSNDVAPTVIFNTAGVQKVFLYTVGGGCHDLRQDSVDITVKASPEIEISATKNPICVGESTSLTASGAGNYSWTPATDLNTTTGETVIASPSAVTNYTVTGTSGGCTGSTSIDVQVRSTTTGVSIAASDNNVTAGTTITFTATPDNGGSNPQYDFRKNNVSVQNGPSPVWSSSTLANNDVVTCIMTSDEPCVTSPVANSNSITMQIVGTPICSNATGLSTTNITAHSARLNWTASLNPAKWQVQYKNVSAGSKWTQIALARNARWIVISSLRANTTYQWRIRAKCGGVWTSYSDVIRFKTLSQQASSLIAQQALQLENEQEEKLSTIKLYPNPTKGQFVIELHLSNNINTNAKIELVNLMGQTVSAENVNVVNGVLQKRVAISSSLAQGIYLVKVLANNKTYLSKLIYEK
jgi:serine protease